MRYGAVSLHLEPIQVCLQSSDQRYVQVHILIFLIAISHVLYAMTSLGIAMHAVRRWRRFEVTAHSGDLLDLPVGQLQREGEHKLWFGLRQGLRQFTHPVDQATFVALRRMFVETMMVRGLPVWLRCRQACQSLVTGAA